MSPTSMQSCPLGRVCGRHPGLGLLPILGWSIWKVKVAGPALGPSFTTNSRGVPQPLPAATPRQGEKGKRGEGRDLEERLVCTMLQLGRLWLG